MRERFRKHFLPGTRWLAIVTQVAEFGVLVELPGYVNGMVHRPDVSDRFFESADEVVAEGAYVTVGLKVGVVRGPLLSLRPNVGTGAVQASPIPIQPAWRTDDVLGIARRMQADGYRDQGIVPILADALEEAGCEVPELLELCRATTVPSERYGWWIAEALLRS